MCVEANENTKQGIFLALKGPQQGEQGYSEQHVLSLERVCGGWWFQMVLESSVIDELGIVWAWFGRTHGASCF